MAYKPPIQLTPSASPLVEGTKSNIAELRPIAGRSSLKQSPLVIPTLKFQPLMQDSLASRLRTGVSQTSHGLLKDTGHRIGLLTPNEHITGLTSTPSRVVNTAIRKLPRNPIPAIRKALNF